jgi:hypothetical protein
MCYLSSYKQNYLGLQVFNTRFAVDIHVLVSLAAPAQAQLESIDLTR